MSRAPETRGLRIAWWHGASRRVRAARFGAAALPAIVLALLAAAVASVVPVSAQMMGARQMSGLPRTVGDLPAGTVVVRVVRDELSNVVSGQRVELTGGQRPEARTTDAEGRAEFTGLAPGVTLQAVTVVDGQRLESRPFEVPAAGGVRLLLVASAPGAAPETPPASAAGPSPHGAPGSVSIGGDSRVVVQFADDELEVFYLFDFVNAGATPVSVEPLVFDMPAEASSVAVLEGSSPQAEAAGRRVIVRGPFAPGTTSVQMAFNLPAPSGRVTVRQPLPVMLQQLALFVEKVPGIAVSSTQVGDQRDMPSEGRTFIVSLGPAVKAGDAISFQLTGVPHRAVWPRNVALAIALLVLAAGAWGAIGVRGRSGAAAGRQALEARRDLLFDEVLALDRRERPGSIDAARRREELIRELERTYGALDTALERAQGLQGPVA